MEPKKFERMRGLWYVQRADGSFKDPDMPAIIRLWHAGFSVMEARALIKIRDGETGESE